MSVRSEPRPAALLVSVIYREERRFAEAVPRVESVAGPVRAVGDVFPFDRTEYYRKEMGAPLFRRFLLAERSVPRGALAKVKVAMESVEADLSEGGRRTVNLDPGLLAPESFILATGKNYSHRVYLGDGVFADLTLVYRGGEYRPLPWTYPDYASEGVRSLLGELRRERLAGGSAETVTACG